MPTTITSTIGSGIGRDYATISAWITGRLAAGSNFVSRDVIEKGVCYPDSDFIESVSISGATTDSTRYWWLTTSVNHGGVAGAGACLNFNNVTGLSLFAGDQYTLVQGLEVKNLQSVFDSFATGIVVGDRAIVDGLLVHGTGSGDGERVGWIGGGSSNPNGNPTVRNCIIYGFGVSGNRPRLAMGINCGDVGGWLVYNNTIVNCISNGNSVGWGIYTGSRSNNTFKNNLVLGSNTADFTSTSGTFSNNVSADSSASGTGSITGATAANEILNATYGSEDCRLKSGAQSINAGTTIAGFSTDIAGTTRPQGAAWDIGAFEFIPTTSTLIRQGFKLQAVNRASTY